MSRDARGDELAEYEETRRRIVSGDEGALKDFLAFADPIMNGLIIRRLCAKGRHSV